ncbi:MAG TPA: NADH-quinone oxidoreductase subunit NuoK [Pirellulaceae bacterium]|nr:NADH-quinone oxidoreductase subunit NuoK [Pirellulaceae bacterium]
MSEITLLYNYLLIGALLFSIGLIGFLVRRNMIIIFLCAELMLQGVSVSLIAWGRYHQDFGGQMLVVFIITVAACEAGIAMAMVLLLAQKSGQLDIVFWQDLRDPGQPKYIDQGVPEEQLSDRVWPQLTTAGVEPQHNLEEELHRSRI